MLESQIGATAAYSFAHFGIKGTFDDYVWCFQRLAELGFHNFNLEILEEEHVDLSPGDVIVLFTDGITEAMKPSSDLFGESRLSRIVEEHGHLESDELREKWIPEWDKIFRAKR